MGYRDDNSFVRKPDGFEVVYTLDGERVLELRVEGNQLVWRQRWHGLESGFGVSAADDLGGMVRGLQLYDSWQDEITRKLEAAGNFGWARHVLEALQMTGFPDGILVQVTFPVNGHQFDKVARSYQGLWDDPDARVRPIAYAVFLPMPVTHRWSAQAEPEASRQWVWRFWEAYGSGLGLVQPFPSEPVVNSDGGTTITIAREGFLHVATMPLRDLLPFAQHLVGSDLVAGSRLEDDPLERPGWHRATAPFRAMASTLGMAVEQDLAFTDAQGEIECMYPTSTATQIWVNATADGAFEGLDF